VIILVFDLLHGKKEVLQGHLSKNIFIDSPTFMISEESNCLSNQLGEFKNLNQ
jgi:hypothetical protein